MFSCASCCAGVVSAVRGGDEIERPADRHSGLGDVAERGRTGGVQRFELGGEPCPEGAMWRRIWTDKGRGRVVEGALPAWVGSAVGEVQVSEQACGDSGAVEFGASVVHPGHLPSSAGRRPAASYDIGGRGLQARGPDVRIH